jgi:hypothetical protein
MGNTDVIELTREQLVQLIAAAKRALYPEAVIVDGEMLCSECHERGLPALVEGGQTMSDGRITARGWDGGASDVSEEGEMLLLGCPPCFQWHHLPETHDEEWR